MRRPRSGELLLRFEGRCSVAVLVVFQMRYISFVTGLVVATGQLGSWPVWLPGGVARGTIGGVTWGTLKGVTFTVTTGGVPVDRPRLGVLLGARLRWRALGLLDLLALLRGLAWQLGG